MSVMLCMHQQVSILLSHFSRFFSFFRGSQKVKSEKVKKANLHGIYISMTNLGTNYKAVGDGEMHLVGIIYPVATHRPCGYVWHHLHDYFPRPPSHYSTPLTAPNHHCTPKQQQRGHLTSPTDGRQQQTASHLTSPTDERLQRAASQLTSQMDE
jgi:hypothetical protein